MPKDSQTGPRTGAGPGRNGRGKAEVPGAAAAKAIARDRKPPQRHRAEAPSAPTAISAERNVLVFQGGGALGAYQAGAYCRLSEAGVEPDWIAGISIGAINAAILAGNLPQDRAKALRGFWERVTAGSPGLMLPNPFLPRQWQDEISALLSMAQGAPGFFRPNPMPPWLMLPWAGSEGAAPLAWYDTAPLERTLDDFIDFDLLNLSGPRLSLGAVDVETGNLCYFDSSQIRITASHVMASGALPPGFAPVEIDGRHYWDGGIVSNTPLFHILSEAGPEPLCIYQLDLYPARGPLPRNIFQAARREKDIRYSSRTRLITDYYRELRRVSAAAARLGARLAEKLGPEAAQDPDLAYLFGRGSAAPVTLVQLIQHGEQYEGQSRDYEFSRQGMVDRWAAGAADVQALLDLPEWRRRVPAQPGLNIYDPTATDPNRLVQTG